MAVRPGAKRAEAYALPAERRGFRRIVNVDLDDPRFDPVFVYAVEVAPERPVQDTLRDLLLQAIALDAKDGAVRSARRQAYREAREYALKTLGAALKGMEADLDTAKLTGRSLDTLPETNISNAITATGITTEAA